MLIGRTGGRIAKGQFQSANKTLFSLPRNEGDNTLHGGPNGFHSYNWDFTTQQTANAVSITFNHLVTMPTDGFPGTVDATITYQLDQNNRVTISYTGQAKNDFTVFNRLTTLTSI